MPPLLSISQGITPTAFLEVLYSLSKHILRIGGSMLEAIVLAGGLGTRLRTVVPDRPKPMAMVAGKPFLKILLESLSKKGFRRVIFSLGFMAKNIIEYFGDHFLDIDLVYVVEQSPLGTGGALRLAMVEAQQDHVFVFNGDTYIDLEIDLIEDLWEKCKSPIIVGKKMSNAIRYGKLLVYNDNVIGFLGKGVSGAGIINAGCYVLKYGQLDRVELSSPFSFENDYLFKESQKTKFLLFVTNGFFIDIGVPDDYVRAQKLLVDI
jgi:D-glycero-alpha-D-manno-heptose 1-phosphate guanylyltransferase